MGYYLEIDYKKKKEDNMTNERAKNRNRANMWLAIALIIVGAMLIASTVLWLTNMSRANAMGTTIDNVYQRNFYDLVDNVNNAEVKISKVLASDYDSYSRKMLGEISKNANSASYNLSNLPISLDGLDETKTFINQVSGYCDSLSDKLDKGQNLSDAELDTLQEIHTSMASLKENLAKFSDEFMAKGYNIFKNGNLLGKDYNNFTKSIQGIKSSDVEYPTMIYDGPFSDGQYNKQIKGLPEGLVDVGEARSVVLDFYKTLTSDDVKYVSDTEGKFSTFDFSAKLPSGVKLYIQVTKNGGKILTISGYGDSSERNVSLNDAILKVKEIIKAQTKIDFDCVWSDIVGGDAYLNFAPVQAGVVIYPDLIKAKVDLASGEIVGYSATAYYTNHSPRQVQMATYAKESASAKIPSGLKVEMSRLCIAPLDYGQERLCYEYKCSQGDDVFYIYINAQNGTTENILKVINTNDGSKLM